jgi:hypothetical protein
MSFIALFQSAFSIRNLPCLNSSFRSSSVQHTQSDDENTSLVYNSQHFTIVSNDSIDKASSTTSKPTSRKLQPTEKQHRIHQNAVLVWIDETIDPSDSNWQRMLNDM